MDPVSALVGATGAVAAQAVAFWSARKVGLGSINARLVEALRELDDTQKKQLTALRSDLTAARAEVAAEREARKKLEQRVRKLEAALADRVVDDPGTTLPHSPRRRRGLPAANFPA